MLVYIHFDTFFCIGFRRERFVTRREEMTRAARRTTRVVRYSYLSTYLIITGAVVALVGLGLAILVYLDKPTVERARTLLASGKTPTAVVYLTHLADKQNDRHAAKMLGELYYTGRGVKKDLRKAMGYLKPVALDGDITAQKMIAYAYYEGVGGIRKDTLQASVFLKMAADNNDANAQYILGKMYYYGEGVGRNFDEAFQYLTDATTHSTPIPAANAILGRMYFKGEGVPQDPVLAERNLRAAATLDDPDVHYMLGMLYYDGAMVGRNQKKAYEHLEKAHILGASAAGSVLGRMLYYGQGVPQDYGKAQEYLLEQADLNNAESQGLLASMYYHGFGGPIDYYSAREMAEAAESTGTPAALAVLGCLYLDGAGGLPIDGKKALLYLKTAADRNDPTACTVLGELHHSGNLVAQDEELALSFLRKGSANGSERAKELLAERAANEAKREREERLALEREQTMLKRAAEQNQIEDEAKKRAEQLRTEREQALAKVRQNWESRRQAFEESNRATPMAVDNADSSWEPGG